MKQYTILHPIYMSFYSRDLYRAVAKEWSTGLCLLYLLSLIALCWIPGIIRIDTDITQYIDDTAPGYVAQMPEITISKGKASIAETQPYVIKDPDSGDPAMIIDTTGGKKSLEKSKASVLLTQDQLILKQNGEERPVLSFADIGELAVTRDLLRGWLEYLREWSAVLTYPFAVIFAFFGMLLQILFYAAVGALFSRFLRVSIPYKLLFRVCSVALTPLIILKALFFFFRVDMPYELLLNASVSTGYLVFAIRAIYSAAPAA